VNQSTTLNNQTPLDDVPHPAGLFRIERLIILIDGVFAITMTLLVLDLRPPDGAIADFRAGLQSMLPRLVIYLLSFFIIAYHWINHFQSIRLVRFADLPLAWLNLINLLFVTLIPASTALLGHYPLEPLAAVCFSLNQLLLCVSTTATGTYIYRKQRMFAPETKPWLLRGIALVWLFNSLGSVMALALSLVSTIAAAVIWGGWPWAVQLWWMRYRRSQSSHVEKPQE
jgi:uncharacterized membrane protein